MGTTVFVGACNSLQLKVMFLHHQWSSLQAFIILISVGAMLAYLAIISQFSINLYEYYKIGYDLLSVTDLFWFYGFFTVPVFVIFIDVLGHNMYYFFRPSKEMMYREIELKVMHNNDVWGFYLNQYWIEKSFCFYFISYIFLNLFFFFYVTFFYHIID